MSTTAPLAPDTSDASLITAVRDGDLEAYGTLFARHVEAARRLARQLVDAGTTDDLVSDAFDRVLGVLQRGGGPDESFRAYLLTTLRRVHVDRARGEERLQPTDDLTPYDPGEPFHDTAVAGFESGAAAEAFSSLPERWQLVLWHTEVEGSKPQEVAELLGISPNSVSALAYRAREGLRQAFLTAHAQEAAQPECSWTRDHLGGFVRGGLARREAGRVQRHLEDCRPCTGLYLELNEVNSGIGALIAPVVLGGAAAGYLGGTAVLTGGGLLGGVGALAGRARDAALGGGQTAAVAGVAASVVVAAGAYGMISGDDAPTSRSDPAPVTESGTGGSDGADGGSDGAGGADDGSDAGQDPAGPGTSTGTTTPPPTATPPGPPPAAAPTGDPGGDTSVTPTAPAGSPGRDRTPAPGPGPGEDDTPGAGPGSPSDPGDTPSSPPPSTPADSAPPPTTDVAVRTSADPALGASETGLWRTTVAVTGLAEGQRTTVEVSLRHAMVPPGQRPERCSGGPRTLTCRVTADAATLRIPVVQVVLHTRLRAEAAPVPGSSDPAPDNNTDELRLRRLSALH